MAEDRTRILLVEDSRTAARILLRMLRGEHDDSPFDVAHAASLEEAGIVLATDGPFLAIVLDLTLPDSSGLETYRVVREAAPDTAVLILSGSEDAALAHEAVELGAQDYVVKGNLDPAALQRSVEYAIAREAARAEVARALQEADDANRRLQDWVALASNELLSPIAAIDALSHLLATSWDQLDDTARLHQAERIHKAAQRLTRTGVHFLQTVRADAVDLHPEPVQLGIHAIARELVEDLQFATTSVEVDPTLAVLGDRVHVETILTNLVRNAVRHGRAPIRITADVHAGHAEIAVVDHGDGIAEEDAGRIFQRYGRGSASAGGTGLGLHAARRMAQANGGELSHDASHAPGTRFVLRLPLAPTAQRTAPVTRAA